jgi:hypothetical protein
MTNNTEKRSIVQRSTRSTWENLRKRPLNLNFVKIEIYELLLGREKNLMSIISTQAMIKAFTFQDESMGRFTIKLSAIGIRPLPSSLF